MVIVLPNTAQKTIMLIYLRLRKKYNGKKSKLIEWTYLHMIWRNRFVFLFCLQCTSFLHIPGEGCYSIFCSVGIQRHKFLSICPRLPNLTIPHSLQTEQWWMIKNRKAFFKKVKTLLFESGLFLFFFLFSAFWALFSTELILIIGWLRVLRIYNIQQGPLDRCTTMSFSNVALNACVISFSPISYR